MYHLLDTPRPSSDLGAWEAVVGPFTQVVGWTSFGEFYLRNPDDGYHALLIVSPPRIVALRFRDWPSFEASFQTPGTFLERRLRRLEVLALEASLGSLGPAEVFVQDDVQPPSDGGVGTYRKLDAWQFAALSAVHHGVGDGGMMDLLLRHLRWNDDPDLWRVAFEHIVEGVPERPGVLVQVGRCSHWLRPHQTRWTADGGFAWPTGYGSGTGGFSREALPQFDWSVTLTRVGDRWVVARDKSARVTVRITIPSRTTWHEQAAVHTVWTTGREKERRFYGFRNKGGVWRCTAETEMAEDRVPR